MVDKPDISSVAALVGDPTRGRMLVALMDGRALTATELALEGGVTSSTASSHLSLLVTAGLVEVAKQGRHRYFRLADHEVAAVVEGLMGISGRARAGTSRRVPAENGARRARVCYDHLAGEVGVRLLERLRQDGLIRGGDAEMELTGRGEAWCASLEIDLQALRRKRRPLCRSCLDWSERRTHLAGAVGAALLERLFALGCARRQLGSRAVILSAGGESFLENPGRVDGLLSGNAALG